MPLGGRALGDTVSTALASGCAYTHRADTVGKPCRRGTARLPGVVGQGEAQAHGLRGFLSSHISARVRRACRGVLGHVAYGFSVACCEETGLGQAENAPVRFSLRDSFLIHERWWASRRSFADRLLPSLGGFAGTRALSFVNVCASAERQCHSVQDRASMFLRGLLLASPCRSRPNKAQAEFFGSTPRGWLFLSATAFRERRLPGSPHSSFSLHLIWPILEQQRKLPKTVGSCCPANSR